MKLIKMNKLQNLSVAFSEGFFSSHEVTGKIVAYLGEKDNLKHWFKIKKDGENKYFNREFDERELYMLGLIDYSECIGPGDLI